MNTRSEVAVRGAANWNVEAVRVMQIARAAGEAARLELQQAALRRAFETEGAALLGVLRGYVRQVCALPGGEAGEIAGEMLGEWYEEAMNSAARFDLRRSPVAWLLGIGYHLALRKKCERGRRADRETLCADLPRGEHEDASDAFERLAREEARLCDPWVPRSERERETREALQQMLRLLPPADRQALCRAVRAGGADAGASAVARQRLCRARKRLQQASAQVNA